jgi:O-antigen/teichoic acid export membrane protein
MIIHNGQESKLQKTSEQQSSYRQIMKATSLFGGVQVFNILISIIKSKFVAVLLGPAGMGIMGLLTSTTNLITRATNLGLGTSAVKDIAAAYGTGDEKSIGITVTVVRRLVWITGLFGLVVTATLSPWLSQLTFGNKDYTLAFVWISVTLLFVQLSKGQLVVLQGLRKLNYLAKANLFGSSLGLIVTLPMYYFWNIDGIVPAIIGTGFITLSMSWYFSRKIKIKETTLTLHQTFSQGSDMIRLGFMISLSGLLSVGASYIIRIFISRTGGVEQVGLYNAGFAIINTYVGLIFTAMATDYYPRLSAVAHDNKLSKQTINQQAEIALLILAPILIVFIVFIKWVIILLYSNKFIGVSGMIYWAALGMFFKSPSWSIGYVFLSKGMSKLFFWNEFSANVYMLSLNILGYHFWGLTGLGISFAASYLFYLTQVYIISKLKFEFSFDRTFLKLFAFQFVLALTGFFVVNFMSHLYSYIIGSLLFILSGLYSIKELENRIGIKKYLNSKFKNHFK